MGEWYWVNVPSDGWHPENGMEERLLCCYHIGSNHARFGEHCPGGGSNGHTIHDSRYHELRREPKWKALIEAQIVETEGEFRCELLALQESIRGLSLQQREAGSMALVAGCDPISAKNALVKYRDEGVPAARKRMDEITKQLVALQKDLFYPNQIAAGAMMASVEAVNQRIFALELYAGIDEGLHRIRDGAPPPGDTPITIFQWLRFMDEETLIDAVEGGMDFRKMEQFDEWAAAHIDDITAGCQRAVIAFKIRRHAKDYGPPNSISDAFAHCEYHMQNKFTYLLIRNGQQVYRYWTAIEFDPRLIPLRGEFAKPLLRERHSSMFRTVNFGKRVEPGDEVVTTDDLDYDDKVKARSDAIRHYNRILYVIQGILDRTKTFFPHPQIVLADAVQCSRWVVMRHDEEDTLPNGNPPSWDDYRDHCNSKLRVGYVVYCIFEYKTNPRSWREKSEYRTYNGFMRVARLHKEGKLRVVDAPGTRYGYEHQTWGEWPMKKRDHHEIKDCEAFNVTAYKAGDYKQFLCDPTLKGLYHKWAPFLLSAEKALKMTPEKLNCLTPPLK